MPEDATAHIEKNKRAYYDTIVETDGSPFFKQKATDVFVTAAAIGYYLEKREPVKDKHDLFRTFSLSDEKSRMWLLKSIAMAVEGVDVLRDLKRVIIICEEFANSGIDYLYEMHTDGSDVAQRLSDTMFEILDE